MLHILLDPFRFLLRRPVIRRCDLREEDIRASDTSACLMFLVQLLQILISQFVQFNLVVLFMIAFFESVPQGRCFILKREYLLSLLEDHCLKLANPQVEVVVFELLGLSTSLLTLTRLELHVVLQEGKLIEKLRLPSLEFMDLASHGVLRVVERNASTRQSNLLVGDVRRSIAVVVNEDLLSRGNGTAASTVLSSCT